MKKNYHHNKRVLVLIIIGTLLISPILVPLIKSILEFIIEGFPGVSTRIVMKSSTIMTFNEYLSLYLTILSILATIFVAYFIYKLDRNNKELAENEEIIHTKRILSVLLVNGIDRAFKSLNNDEWINFDFIRITEDHIGMIAEIGHLLSEDQFLYLNKTMETLKDIADHEKNGDPGDAKNSVKSLLQLITIPIYPMYYFYIKDLRSIYDVMTKEAIQIFKFLSEKDNIKVFTYGSKYNSQGRKLFKSFPGNRYKVYNHSGEIICDALVDNTGIIKGNAKIFHEEDYLEYEGSFLAGKRCGDGIEYYLNKKTKEGIWKDNQLIEGIIYDVILNSSGKIYDGEIYQLGVSIDLNSLKKNHSQYKIGNVKFNNGQMKVIKGSIRKVTDILEDTGIFIPEQY